LSPEAYLQKEKYFFIEKYCYVLIWAMSREGYISTNDADGVLGVTRQRVLQLIQDGRLKAQKFANVYMIRRGGLDHIEEKPVGRPTKTSKKGGKK
jgi:hypothetical protein